MQCGVARMQSAGCESLCLVALWKQHEINSDTFTHITVRLFYRTHEGFVSFRGTVSTIMSGFCAHCEIMDERGRKRMCVFHLCVCVHAYIYLCYVYLPLSSNFCKGTNAPSSVRVRLRALAWMCVYAWMHLCACLGVCVCVCVYVCVCEACCWPSKQTGVRSYQCIAPVTRWKPGGEKVNHRATLGKLLGLVYHCLNTYVHWWGHTRRHIHTVNA